MGFILIYTTASNMREARKMAEMLLEKRLIACANFFSAQSSYLWKGEIESAKEIVLILKTKKNNWLKVKSEIEKIHSYDLPCIIKIGAEANKGFTDWIESETN